MKGYFITGFRIVPLYMIVLYPVFISTDIITTYMATPDLKYEMNPIIVYFNLGYRGMISLAIVYFVFGLSAFLISREYQESYFKGIRIEGQRFTKGVFLKRGVILSFLLLWYFYNHFIATAYSTVNNYLGYIYLSKSDHFLKFIADRYIESTHIGIKGYYFLSQGVLSTAGLTVSVMRVWKTARK